MNRTDHWGGCTPYVNDTRCPVGPYMRNTSSTFGSDNMVVYEPCNYVSNVAYFRSAVRVCNYANWTASTEEINAVKRGFITLAMGSAFWHDSHTYVGYSFDNNMIAVISYLAHQQSVAQLPFSSILHEISPTNRSTNGVGVADQLTQMTINHGVPEWAQILDTADLPHDYFITFAALISTGFSLVMPFFLVRALISAIAYAIIPKDDADFVVNSYLPALEKGVILI